jgi:DNA gyrase subunit A
MLDDINKDTVDFVQNFDGTLSEPEVLPAAVPNLLVNGVTGIAVGMSTSIPPHNLGEVVDALIFMLQRWDRLDDVSVEDLMRFIQGPDFPTGGLILQQIEEGGLIQSYATGRGRIQVRARAHVEEMSRGRHRIIVTELPFMTNKSSLIERIAKMARDGDLEGLADLRDESDRQGLRIVIELTKSAVPEEVLLDLYKRTPMQNTFSFIMLALVDGEPRRLSLKQALRYYLEHRLEIVRRRSDYDLTRARNRAHILEGLRVAINHIDEVIDLIRRSHRVDTARNNLIRRFNLTRVQAQAILDMPLRRLASLERKKIEDEYKDVLAQIKSLEKLLASPKKMRQVIAEELQSVRETYDDRRRTQIVDVEGERYSAPVRLTELAPAEDRWVMVSTDGLISRTLEDKPPRLSGRDAPSWLLKVNSRDTLYLVTDKGKAAAIPVLSLPEAEKPSNGVPFPHVSPLGARDRLAFVLTLPPKSKLDESWYIVSATRGGMVKKSAVGDLPGPAAKTFTLVKVNDGDSLGWIRLSNGKKDVLLVTARGMAIRFSEQDVRPMGLVAAGVIGIKLHVGDEVVGMELLPQKGELFFLASNGRAKRVAQKDFPKQGRYGQGVVAWKLPEGVRLVGIAIGKYTQRVILHLAKYAAKSIRLDDAPLQKRTAVRGKVVLEVRKGDRLLGLSVPWDIPRPVNKAQKK